jgi:hypothetical protein
MSLRYFITGRRILHHTHTPNFLRKGIQKLIKYKRNEEIPKFFTSKLKEIFFSFTIYRPKGNTIFI